MSKRYYWLKLKNDFFKDKRIKKLRKIAGGDTYTIIYLKMQLLSLQDEGILYYEGVEDSFEEEIALEIDEDIEDVKITIGFLLRHGLLKQDEKNEYQLPETIDSIGSESDSAERVRKFRNNQKMLQCNNDVTKCNIEIDIEKEKEKDIEKNKEENLKREFERLWNIYPNKKGKKDAYNKFLKAIKKDTTIQQIEDGINKYNNYIKISNTQDKYIKHGSTWFNQECWNDDYTIKEEILPNWFDKNLKIEEGIDDETRRLIEEIEGTPTNNS